MSQELMKVYDLKEDQEKIRLIQKASLETEDFGFVPEHGLFGSPQWWRAIDNAAIPVYTISGVISRLHMSGHNDWPEFEIDDGNEKTRWTREGKGEAYEVGKIIRLKYVLQRKKKEHIPGMKYSKTVLEIWIGNNRI